MSCINASVLNRLASLLAFGLELWSLQGENGLHWRLSMALEQMKMFLVRMQDDPDLKAHVLAAATADDEATIAAGLG